MVSDPTQSGGRRPDLLGPEDDADIPPPPHGLQADPVDEQSRARLRAMSRRRPLLPVLLVVAAIGAFVAIVWWAYQTANRPPETLAEVPVVEAEPGEPKVRPESEGGMNVPNQDKLIYEQLSQGEGEPAVERLLPPPEEPLDPPAPPPPAVPEVDTSALTPPPPPQEVTPSPEGAEGETAMPAPAPAEAPAPESMAEAAAPAPAESAEPTAPALEATAQEEGGEEVAPPAEAAARAPETEPEAAPAPTAQATAAGAGFRIQLAAVKSEADARAAWDRLQKAHAELLGGLQPTIQRADLGEQGIFYRVQGGPLPSREAAAALCERLKAKSQACLVVKP